MACGPGYLRIIVFWRFLLSNHEGREKTRRKNKGLKISLFAILVFFVVQIKSMGYDKNEKPQA